MNKSKTFFVVMTALAAMSVCVANGGVAKTGGHKQAREFNWKNVSWQALKLGVMSGKVNLSQVNHDAIVAAFMTDVYKAKSGSAFAMHAAYPKAIKIGDKKVKKWDSKRLFIIRTTFKFGKYDFKKHVFPLKPFSARTYLPVKCCAVFESNHNWMNASSYDDASGVSKPWPYDRYDLFLENYGIVNGLPMSEKKAASFINARTNGSYVNRTVYAEIFVSINGLSNKMDDSNAQALMAHIQEVKVYADQNKARLLHVYK